MVIISQAIIELSLLVILGFVLYRKKIINDNAHNFLTNFVVNFTIPSLFFSQLVGHPDIIANQNVIKLILLSVIVFFVGYVVGLVFSFKRNTELRREFISLLSFQNGGYIPMNIALFLSMAYQEEFLVYIVIYLLGFDILFWSIGSFIIFRKKGDNFSYKTFFSPPIVSKFLGLFCIYAGLYKFIPNILLSPIKAVGDLSFVLSMIVLGCFLGKVRLKGLREKLGIILETVFLKLVVVPLLFILVIIKFKIFSLFGLFAILQAAMPSAASLPIVVNLHRADSEFVSQGVFLSHIISIVTIPFWMGVFLKVSGFNF